MIRETKRHIPHPLFGAGVKTIVDRTAGIYHFTVTNLRKEFTINRDSRMYVSWTDILSAVAAIFTGIVGLFLLFLKALKWYRNKNKVQ